MNSLPPTFTSANFNTNAFNSGGYLTKSQADLLYLPYSTVSYLGYLYGVTPGTVTASKAVIVDSSKNIIGFNNIQSDGTIDCNALDINNNGDINLYGTANNLHFHSTTAASISLFGTISNTITFSGSTGFLLMSGNSQYIALDGTTNFIRIANTAPSTNSTSGALRIAGGAFFGANTLIQTNTNNGLTLYNTSSTALANIYFKNDTLNAYELGIRGSAAGNNSNFYLWDNTNSVYKFRCNTSGNVILNETFTLTTAGALDGLISIGVKYINNTVSRVSYQDWTNDLATDIIVSMQMSNIAPSFGTSSNHKMRFMSNNTNQMYLQTSGNFSIGSDTDTHKLYVSGTIACLTSLTIGSTIITEAEIGVLDGVTPGTATASKALVLDASSNIATINSLTATSITGTLQTAAQTNITTVGTLNGLAISTNTANGLTISNTNVSSLNNILFKNSSAVSLYEVGSRNPSASNPGNFYIYDNVNSAYRMRISSGSIIFNQLVTISTTGGLSGITTLAAETITSSTRVNSNVTDAVDGISYGLACTHTASGTITNDVYATGMLFNASNDSAAIVSYGRIYSTVQLKTSGNHQGSLMLSAVLSAAFVDIMELKCLTSSTHNACIIKGATSVLTVYHCSTTLLTGTIQTAAQPNITSVGTLTSLTLSGAVSGITTLGLSGILTSTNTTDSSSVSTGSIVSSGGLGLAKNAYIGGLLRITDTTDSTSVSTGSFNTLGGLSITKACWIGTTLNVNTPVLGTSYGELNVRSSGYALNILNSSTRYTRMATDSSGQFLIETNTATGALNSMYLVDKTVSFTGSAPRFKMDIGNTSADFIINLYNTASNAPSTGFGYSSSKLNIISADSIGFYTTKNVAISANTYLDKGTLILNLDSTGDLNIGRNLHLSLGGVHSYSYDTTGLSSYGAGAHMHYASSKASFFGYDYSTSTYKNVSIGQDRIFVDESGGFVGIGTTSPACKFHVVGTTAQTNSATYGYLSSSGAGSSTGFVGRLFSIRCSGALLCDSGEINCFSDIRLKENIIDLDTELVTKFIENIKPIQFNYKIDDKQPKVAGGQRPLSDTIKYGFSAQQLIEYDFNRLVGFTEDQDENLIEMDIQCVNGNTINLKKNQRLVVNLLDMIPILTKAIQLQQKQLNDIKSVLSPAMIRKLNNLI